MFNLSYPSIIAHQVDGYGNSDSKTVEKKYSPVDKGYSEIWGIGKPEQEDHCANEIIVGYNEGYPFQIVVYSPTNNEKEKKAVYDFIDQQVFPRIKKYFDDLSELKLEVLSKNEEVSSAEAITRTLIDEISMQLHPTNINLGVIVNYKSNDYKDDEDDEDKPYVAGFVIGANPGFILYNGTTATLLNPKSRHECLPSIQEYNINNVNNIGYIIPPTLVGKNTEIIGYTNLSRKSINEAHSSPPALLKYKAEDLSVSTFLDSKQLKDLNSADLFSNLKKWHEEEANNIRVDTLFAKILVPEAEGIFVLSMVNPGPILNNIIQALPEGDLRNKAQAVLNETSHLWEKNPDKQQEIWDIQAQTCNLLTHPTEQRLEKYLSTAAKLRNNADNLGYWNGWKILGIVVMALGLAVGITLGLLSLATPFGVATAPIAYTVGSALFGAGAALFSTSSYNYVTERKSHYQLANAMGEFARLRKNREAITFKGNEHYISEETNEIETTEQEASTPPFLLETSTTTYENGK